MDQPTSRYAGLVDRIIAAVIDEVLLLLSAIPYVIGAAAFDDGVVRSTLTGLGGVAFFALFVWNVCLRGGRTGWTVGKQAVGIRLVSHRTGQPIGALLAFARALYHVVDALACYLGYLWPAWDPKKQTFADKLAGTVVMSQDKRSR